MKMRIRTIFILLTLLVLTACASPSSASPTPTIVRLDRSALATPAEATEEAAEASPTETSTPLPSAATPTPTLETPEATVTATVQVSATAAVEPAVVQVEIIAAGLNVRDGAGMNSSVIGTVARGDILDITSVSADGNWLQVVTPDGQSGWISSQPAYIRLIGSLDDLPPAGATSDSQSSTATGAGAASQPPAVMAQAPAAGQPASTAAGRLVFNTSNGGDLYVINIDGTGLQKLASGVIDPVVSPDGQQVAFTRWDGAEFGTLYVMNLDGSGERAVLDETRQAKSPTWSPDGQNIIVSFQHGGLRDPSQECRRFSLGEEVRLPENVQVVGTKFIGDKDAIEICYIPREDLQWGLRQVNLATGEFKDLPADLYSFNPTWDPRNPSRIIYDGLRGLMQLDLASGDLQPFTDNVSDTAPVFSPDGQKLALTFKQHDHWEVYTYDLASGARQRLTKPPILATPQYSSAAPAWSPDGSQLAFVTDRSGQWEIWVMNVDGSNPRPLFAPELQAQWGLSYQGVNERMLSWIGGPVAGTTPPAAASNQPASPSAGDTGSPASASLSGAWDFTFGTMNLTQRSSKVEGSYQWYGGIDTGRVDGIFLPDLNQFQGLWVSDRSPNSQGILRWQLGGNSFSGNFDGARSGQWCGVRSGQPLPAGCGFSGVWNLRFGNPPGTGQAILVQTGQTVQGTFVDSQGRTGEIVDGVITVESITEMKLAGTWRNDQGEQDTFEWRLNLTTGQAFEGRRNPGNSDWCGWREGASEPEQCGW